MGKINVLPFNVANLIAAGEVVDRPASVIKELAENAIDAGATRIVIEIKNGGVTFMRVADNGCGISPEDLPVSIKRHATSKIKEASDLDSIATLGFRGEALAAISSVSDLRIISKTKNAEYGCVLEAHAGEIVSLKEQGCPDGTSVIVENLFANVPARRKFLKKDFTEAMAVAANIEKIALSHPEIAFQFISDGITKMETVGDHQLSNTIYALYGREFSSKMIEINTENEGIGVKGFIGRTDNFRANRNFENFFINGRYVKSKTAMAALEQAYTSYMPPEKFPCSVLMLSINPSRVDVNVHPAKLEVKFSNEKPVFDAVYYAVRDALESNTTRPNFELGLDNTKRRTLSFTNAWAPVEDKNKADSLEKRQITYDTVTLKPQQERMTAEEFRKTIQNVAANNFSNTPMERQSICVKEKLNSEPIAQPISKATEDIQDEIVQNDSPILEKKAIEKEESATQPVSYRIVGELFHSYVVVEVDEKALIVDKHAAHERIIFESFKKNLITRAATSQALLLPIEVMLTTGEIEALKRYQEELNNIGFSLRYDRNIVFVDAIPEEINTDCVDDVLQTMADRILNATGSVKLTRDILFEKALYQASCKAAIKAGRDYADEHIAWIIEQLMKLPDITFCPHGRPVAMELSHHALDKQFDRTGF